MAGWMEGIKVVDFSWGMAGPLATMWLCDYGAEVVRVEPPGGDAWWREPGSLLWNRGKQSVVLDLHTPEGRGTAAALASQADIVVECFRPGEADALGIGYGELAGRNPRLVYCSISAFGSRGPYRDWPPYEEIVAAKLGTMASLVGWFSDRPVYKALPLGSYAAACLATQGILAALHVREQTGRGQQVETSLLAGLLAYGSRAGALFADDKLNQQSLAGLRQLRADGKHFSPGYRMCECADGKWIQLGCAQQDLYLNLLHALGLDEEAADPRFSSRPNQMPDADRKEIIRRMEERIRTQPRDHWVRRFEEFDAAYAIPNTTEEFLDDPQVQHLGLVVDVDDPRVGRTQQLGKWFETFGGEWRVKGPAPLPGQHTQEVLAGLKGIPAPVTGGAPDGDRDAGAPRAPLEGITVLELATWLAAPLGSKYLADLGAEVIKVEPPTGDPFRLGTNYLQPGRGKRDIVVDLKSEQGQKIVRELAQRCDVVLHNFRPGVPERLGVDYATLKAVNPRIVYCYGASFGSTGPYAHRPAFAPVIAATTGTEVAQAGEGNPPQVYETADNSAGLGVAVGILMGLFQRDRTGQGQQVETRMLTSDAYLNSEDAIRYPGKPSRRRADQQQLGLEALYRLYQARGEGWVFLACPTDHEWTKLCRVLNREDLLQDLRFAAQDRRRDHSAALAQILEPVFRTREAEDWESALLAQGVPCVVAHRHLHEVFYDDPHYRANELVAELSHPTYGRYQQAGVLIRFSETPGGIRRTAPLFGEHSLEILRELGYSDEAAEALGSEGVVKW